MISAQGVACTDRAILSSATSAFKQGSFFIPDPEQIASRVRAGE